MQTIKTIGLDIAKSVFQVHGVDAGGQVIVRRQLKRRYVLTFFQKLSPGRRHRCAQHLGPAAMDETGGMAASREALLTTERYGGLSGGSRGFPSGCAGVAGAPP